MRGYNRRAQAQLQSLTSPFGGGCVGSTLRLSEGVDDAAHGQCPYHISFSTGPLGVQESIRSTTLPHHG